MTSEHTRVSMYWLQAKIAQQQTKDWMKKCPSDPCFPIHPSTTFLKEWRKHRPASLREFFQLQSGTTPTDLYPSNPPGDAPVAKIALPNMSSSPAPTSRTQETTSPFSPAPASSSTEHKPHTSLPSCEEWASALPRSSGTASSTMYQRLKLEGSLA